MTVYVFCPQTIRFPQCVCLTGCGLTVMLEVLSSSEVGVTCQVNYLMKQIPIVGKVAAYHPKQGVLQATWTYLQNRRSW